MGKKNALARQARGEADAGRVDGITFDAGGLIAPERNHRGVFSIDGTHAQAVGALLAPTSTSDITDAHVVICSRAAGYAVITSGRAGAAIPP